MAEPPKICIFLHGGEYDRVHQGLSIAATAAAAGRPVDVFFFWWALERLVSDRLDAPDFAREEVNDRFEQRGAPTLRRLLAHLRETKACRLFACSGSMEILGLEPGAVSQRVDQIVGWNTILAMTAGVVDRFYL